MSIVTAEYVELARFVAGSQGIPSVATAVIPHEVMSGAIQDVRPSCEAAVDQIIHALTGWGSPEVSGKSVAQEVLVFEGKDYQDAADRMESHFLAQKWSDGLPLVPPTRERVEWMLSGMDPPRDTVLAVGFEPRFGLITVENVAVNAAMAGGRPEYMPVILAAVDALEKADRALMRLLNGSTSNFGPLLMINGPIARQLNVNSSYGMMGPGWKANATIGRIVNLLLTNGGGGHSGPAGNPTVQGFPARYSWCFAENEEASPWKPFHMELGFDKGDSTVTIMAARGMQPIHLRPPAERVLGAIARQVHSMAVVKYGPMCHLLVLSPAHAEIFADSGWSKEDIRSFVFDARAQVALARVEAEGIAYPQEEWVKSIVNIVDKASLAPRSKESGDLAIVVGGAPGTYCSTFVSCSRAGATAKIDPFKPRNWPELLQQAGEEL